MKNLTFQIIAIVVVLLSLSSCGKEEDVVDDFFGNNEYQIKVDGNVFDEGKSMFAGISEDVSNDNSMVAGLAVTLSILFEKKHYNKGEVLIAGPLDDSNTTAFVSGMLVKNPDTDNEEMIYYVAESGTVKIVNKKKIEFNVTCYNLFDFTDEGAIVAGAVPFVVSGFVNENNPQ